MERFTYDSMGRLLRRYEPSFGTSVDYTEYSYYPDGHAWEDRVRTVRDPRGKVTTHEYDYAFVAQGGTLAQGTIACAGRGLLTKTIYADGTYTSAAFDKFGKMVWQENELRLRTTTTYDDYQRPLTVTDPLGRVTTYDYALGGFSHVHTEDKPSAITHPSGRREAFTYDGRWRPLTHTLGHGSIDAATTTHDYDLAGNLESVTDPLGRVTSFAYDNRNRKTHQYAPLSRTTRWEYDAAGNVTKVIQPDTTYTRQAYDTMNRVTDAWDERNQHTGYTYHASGLVNVITDPNNRTYTHAYDASGRPTSRTYPDASVESWSYDPAGNRATETTRSGQILRLYYDDRNREYWRAWDSNAAPFVGTQFDAAGRVTAKYNWHGWLSYGFDAAGQMTSESQKIYGPTSTEDGQSYDLYFGYDADGNRSWIHSPSLYHGYVYNARQQLTAIQFGGGWDWATFTYDAAGQRIERVQANYTGATYGYDGAGRLNYLRSYRRNDGTGVLLQRFGYDLRDRRTWQMRDDQFGDTWEYFEDSQLKKQRTQVWRPDQNINNPAAFTDTFAYDPAGNRTSWNENGAVTTYTVDNCNRYTAISGLAIQHADGRGNVTQLGGWSFTYDADNRMTRAVGPGHDLWPHYDAMGRLSKIVDHTGAGVQYEYRFYDGSQPIIRARADGSWIDHLVWGPTPDELISRYVPSQHPSDWWSRWQFCHQDPLNSVVAVTNSAGTVLERYRYDAFGEAAIYDASWNARTVSAIGNRWLFTGQEWWAECGLHNYKARWYCNRLGRFLQNDPIRFAARDLNLYRYVSNQPINRLDPTGLLDPDGGFRYTEKDYRDLVDQITERIIADTENRIAPADARKLADEFAREMKLFGEASRLSSAQADLEKAKQSGNPEKIKKADEELGKAAKEVASAVEGRIRTNARKDKSLAEKVRKYDEAKTPPPPAVPENEDQERTEPERDSANSAQ